MTENNSIETGDTRLDTKVVHGAEAFEPRTGAISTPIFQSAAFRHPALGQSTGYDYSRAVNPTREVLEKTMAILEGGKYGLAFASGMGAISCIIKLFAPGTHVIMSEDLYGGTFRLFDLYYAKWGYKFSWIDTSDFSKIEAALTNDTKVIFIETPSNPMMKVTDIQRCADFIHKRGGHLICDNTFSTPYFQNPLQLGADFVIHSGTKYLCGHNDTLSGFVVHSKPEFKDQLEEAQRSEGACLSAFDAWLTLRGIKTLALRMERHQSNAYKIAHWLREQKIVEKVFYTGFTDHPHYALMHKQTRGHSGMISFYVTNKAAAESILKNLQLILFAESLGGTETLMTHPLVQTHAAIPCAMRESSGINDRLLRLSVGIENPDDLIADLAQAFAAAITAINN